MLVLVKKPHIELSIHGEHVSELVDWIRKKNELPQKGAKRTKKGEDYDRRVGYSFAVIRSRRAIRSSGGTSARHDGLSRRIATKAEARRAE